MEFPSSIHGRKTASSYQAGTNNSVDREPNWRAVRLFLTEVGNRWAGGRATDGKAVIVRAPRVHVHLLMHWHLNTAMIRAS